MSETGDQPDVALGTGLEAASIHQGHSPLGGPHRRRNRWRVVASLVVVSAAVVGGLIAVSITHDHHKHPPLTAPSQSAAHYLVAPDGHGNCVVTACGTLNAAVARAKADGASGALVELAAGHYGSQTVSEPEHARPVSSNIVVEPMTGAVVTMDGLTMNASSVTIRKITFLGSVKLQTGATASGLDGITTKSGSIFLGASKSFLTGSRITPAVDSDGIQVKAYDGNNPDGVTITHTTVGPTSRGPKQTHVDCLQILGGSNITVRYNRLFHCADQGIISGAGATGNISGLIDIERNEIQLCPQRSDSCDGHDAVSIKGPNVTFVHNTVIDGGAVFSVKNLTVAANYIANLKSCGGTIEANLIGTTQCAGLSATNKRGQLEFADVDASPPNLTPRNPPTLPDSSAWIGGVLSDVDIDGRPVTRGSATVGAVQVTADGQ